MLRPKIIVFLTFLIIFDFGHAIGQGTIDLDNFEIRSFGKDITHYHISGSELFSDSQNIHIISITLESLKSKYTLDIAWSDSIKYTTSSFAENSGAIAAINAGFFNVAEGGSVTYLEYGNERVGRRSWRGDTHPDQKTNMNGSLLLLNTGKIVIEKARTSYEYINSHLEKWVLVTGPLLIQDGAKSQLLSGRFVDKRHPRTVVGITNESLLMITIDGRHAEAKGMNLPELQDFLIIVGCIHAINLDGGGSTTMWLKTDSIQGVISCPSDNRKFDQLGERKVANALVLLSN